MDIPKDAPLVYISFSGEINPSTAETLTEALANCVNSNVQQIHLLLSTTGGTVREAINLYNVLKGMPFELTTHNVSEVNSSGNVLFLAGKKRYATANATFMFHGVGYAVQQGYRLEEKDVREKLTGILREQQRIGDVISKNTSISTKEIASLFKKAQTKNASFALDKGIIHEIREVQLIKGSPVISLAFKR
jgi:ATP-dependent protease ClpP protease subunit